MAGISTQVDKELTGQNGQDCEHHGQDTGGLGRLTRSHLDGPTDHKSDAERHIADGHIGCHDNRYVDAATNDGCEEAEDHAEDIVSGRHSGQWGRQRTLLLLRGIGIMTRIRLRLRSIRSLRVRIAGLLRRIRLLRRAVGIVRGLTGRRLLRLLPVPCLLPVARLRRSAIGRRRRAVGSLRVVSSERLGLLRMLLGIGRVLRSAVWRLRRILRTGRGSVGVSGLTDGRSAILWRDGRLAWRGIVSAG